MAWVVLFHYACRHHIVSTTNFFSCVLTCSLSVALIPTMAPWEWHCEAWFGIVWQDRMSNKMSDLPAKNFKFVSCPSSGADVGILCAQLRAFMNQQSRIGLNTTNYSNENQNQNKKKSVPHPNLYEETPKANTSVEIVDWKWKWWKLQRKRERSHRNLSWIMPRPQINMRRIVLNIPK